jgi:hypothetical protein
MRLSADSKRTTFSHPRISRAGDERRGSLQNEVIPRIRTRCLYQGENVLKLCQSRPRQGDGCPGSEAVLPHLSPSSGTLRRASRGSSPCSPRTVQRSSTAQRRLELSSATHAPPLGKRVDHSGRLVEIDRGAACSKTGDIRGDGTSVFDALCELCPQAKRRAAHRMVAMVSIGAMRVHSSLEACCQKARA